MSQRAPSDSHPPPTHHRATTVLVLGILGVAGCQVLAPFAWVMGHRALAEIDASRGHIGGRDVVNTGRLLGMVGTLLMIGSLAIPVVFFFLSAA